MLQIRLFDNFVVHVDFWFSSSSHSTCPEDLDMMSLAIPKILQIVHFDNLDLFGNLLNASRGFILNPLAFGHVEQTVLGFPPENPPSTNYSLICMIDQPQRN